MKKWKVGWGIEAKCNMKCAFCYSEKTRKSIGSLGYKDWVKFIDENHERVAEINYGTGENTLSYDWFEFIYYVRKNYPEIGQALTTNGYLSERIKDARYKKIIEESIDEVDISLDFSDKNKHNEWRGQENAYDWALKTLEFLKDTDILSTIVFIGTNETFHKNNLDGLFEIAGNNKAKLRMNLYRPTNGIDEKSKRFISSFYNILEALYYINDNYKVLSICDPLFSSIITKGNLKSDPSGVNSIRILSDGSITPSTYLISEEFRRVNITMENALSLIEEDKLFNEFKLAPVPSSCSGCSYIEGCRGGVYDRRYLWYKSFKERDPYCPYRLGDNQSFREIAVTREEGFSSIHDGYLPTMFFSV